MVVSGFSHTQELSADAVGKVLAQLGDFNVRRLVVTDQNAKVVYDSAKTDPILNQAALFPEIVLALEGNNVVYCAYEENAITSRGAMPLLYYGKLIGAVYLMEYDTSQGQLIAGLQNNILRISLVLEVVVVLFSLIFAATFSHRMRRILHSIHIIQDGNYSHKVRLKGHDEVAKLGAAFNSLTDRLQDSEGRRRQFVSDASHELKTPLASIKLLSDSILQNPMDEETIREFVSDIGSEADRLTRMSEKLLYLTKIDMKKEENAQERELADIGQTAQRVLRMIAPVAELNKIRLEDRSIPNCTILMMEDDLYQIIFNLVENGIKYNQTGGSLTVRMERTQEEICLFVEDTGVGIPEDALPYIFDRFYRVDKARSRQAGGSGLGLSSVHDMVLRNDGTIQVSRRAEGGTCFAVTFPAFDME